MSEICKERLKGREDFKVGAMWVEWSGKSWVLIKIAKNGWRTWEKLKEKNDE